MRKQNPYFKNFLNRWYNVCGKMDAKTLKMISGRSAMLAIPENSRFAKAGEMTIMMVCVHQAEPGGLPVLAGYKIVMNENDFYTQFTCDLKKEPVEQGRGPVLMPLRDKRFCECMLKLVSALTSKSRELDHTLPAMPPIPMKYAAFNQIPSAPAGSEKYWANNIAGQAIQHDDLFFVLDRNIPADFDRSEVVGYYFYLDDKLTLPPQQLTVSLADVEFRMDKTSEALVNKYRETTDNQPEEVQQLELLANSLMSYAHKLGFVVTEDQTLELLFSGSTRMDLHQIRDYDFLSAKAMTSIWHLDAADVYRGNAVYKLPPRITVFRTPELVDKKMALLEGELYVPTPYKSFRPKKVRSESVDSAE